MQSLSQESEPSTSLKAELIFSTSGIGVGLTRDPATLMLGQYFKRKRARVETVLVAGSGIGIALMSIFIQVGIR